MPKIKTFGVGKFLYALGRDVVSDEAPEAPAVTGLTRFLYALGRDVVSDFTAEWSYGVQFHGFYTPLGVTWFLTGMRRR